MTLLLEPVDQLPDSTHARLPHNKIAETLRERPNQWFLVYEGRQQQAINLASVIRRGFNPAYACLSFEATARMGQTYARYVEP